jgi:hypothetical protein
LVFLRLDKLLERVLEIGGRHPLVHVLPFPRALPEQDSCGHPPKSLCQKPLERSASSCS